MVAFIVSSTITRPFIKSIQSILLVQSGRGTVVRDCGPVIIFVLVRRSQYKVQYISMDDCSNGIFAYGTPFLRHFAAKVER